MACARLRDLARGAAALAVVAAILTVASGCGDDSDDAEPPDRPSTTDDTSTTAPPTTAPAPEAAVEAAYVAFIEMVERISTTTNDPNDPELVERSIEPMLGALRDNIATDHTESRVWRIGDQTQHRVQLVEIQGVGAAVVTDCSTGNDVLVDSVSGEVVREGTLTTSLLKVTLVLVDGSWKVAHYESSGNWDGVGGCAG